MGIEAVKQHKRALIERYAQASDGIGTFQVLITLAALALLWRAVAWSAEAAPLLLIPITLLMSLFLLRVFVLMHECGHGSLFQTPALNRVTGFFLGVVSGMPQYVWAQHHAFHHSCNGNWNLYRGPLSTLSVEEYARLNPAQQRAYVRARHLAMAPLGGLMYLLVNPRWNWIKGTAALGLHLLSGKRTKDFKTRYWKNAAEYRHMSANNVVLLSLWVLMSLALGPGLFFGVYIVSMALSGGAGIVLFTVQLNFEHSYASTEAGWCYDTAALEGTSYLVLPGWLNWFTANIGYHHVHHLSARIPNYRLAACHAENADLFAKVPRIGLWEIRQALRHLLWDTAARRIVSVAEYEAQRAV